MALRPIPAEAVVLGIDPGEDSGHALLFREPRTVRARLDVAGTCRTAVQRRDVVAYAIRRAAELALPLVFCIEDHAHQGLTPATFAGLRSSAARWKERAESDAPDAPILDVMPNRWRAGCGLHARGTDAWKRAAVLGVRARYGIWADHDAAESACIATWALFSDEILAALATAQRRAARAARAEAGR